MWRAHLKLNFVVFIWSFTSILGKLMTLPALETVFFRTAFAAVLLFVWIVYGLRRRLMVPGRTALMLLANGGIIGLHWVLFFMASKISVSICLAGIATTTLWTALLAPIFTRKRWLGLELLMGVIIVIALYGIFRSLPETMENQGQQLAFTPTHALFIALASAMAAAVFSLVNGRITPGLPPTSVTFYEMAGAAITCLIALPMAGWLSGTGSIQWLPEGLDWLWLGILVVVCTVYAYSAYIHLLKSLSVFTINLAANFEPVYGILLAAVLFGEYQSFGWTFYAGILAILGSVILHTVVDHRQAKRAALRVQASTG